MVNVIANDDKDELVAQAASALVATSIYGFGDLIVETHDDCLLLSGRVSTFYHKQVAQEAIRHVAGDCRVINRIEVDEIVG